MPPDLRSALLSEAIEVLAANDTGRYIRPGPRQYPGQWNWDAAFSVIGLAHVDPPRARREVLSLLCGQWQDGMVPHIVFHDADVDYYPGPAVWGRAPGMPELPTSGITQPPLLACAVAHLHALHPDQEFLAQVLDPLQGWHRWFLTQRVERGVVNILHPWESGMDNSPRFDAALASVPAPAASIARRDRRHVPADQRPTDDDYRAYLAIVETLRRRGYRPAAGESPFQLGDVFLTSILICAEADLARLLGELERDPRECLRRRDVLRWGLASLWDESAGLFRADGEVLVPTTGGLLPAQALQRHPSCARLASVLDDSHTFGPTPRGPYPPSVARSSEYFDERRYWRGPVWANVNWLAYRSLRAAGHDAAAERLRASTLDMVGSHGFWEYYSPTTGEGLGSDRFSWTAAVTIDLLYG